MQKILALESLRGLAALIVVFHHAAYAFYPAMVAGASAAVTHSSFEHLVIRTPLNVLINGQFAVVCFFVLSGFVLSYGYFTRSIDLVTAAIKRYFRLVPVVFVSLIFSYVLLKLHLYKNVPAAEITQSAWLAQFWPNDPKLLDTLWHGLIGTFATQPLANSLNPVLWTIYYELIGSLIVYAFLSLAGKDRRRWILYLIFMLVFVNTWYVGFILGVLLCDLYVHKQESFKKIGFLKKGYKIVLLVVAIELAAFPAYVASALEFGRIHGSLMLFSDYNLTKNILYLGASLIFVTLLLTSHKIKTLLEQKVFVHLGSMSYSLYATHLLVLGSVGSMLFIAFSSFLPYNFAVLATVPCYLLTAVVVAYIFRRYVDEPSVRFSKNIVEILKLGSSGHKKEYPTEELL